MCYPLHFLEAVVDYKKNALFESFIKMRFGHSLTLCHTFYPIAIEARSAVATVSTQVVFAVRKLGTLSIVRTCVKVV